MTTRNVGYQWETTIDTWHGRYLRAGIGVVYKTTPPSLTTRRGVRTVDIGPLDFVGHLHRVPVLFDAKATSKSRWQFSGLVHKAAGRDRSPHQARQMDLWMATGGVSGLLLRLEAPWGPGYLIPWWRLQATWWEWYEAGRRGAAQAGIDGAWCQQHAYRINMHEGYLGALQQALEER